MLVEVYVGPEIGMDGVSVGYEVVAAASGMVSWAAAFGSGVGDC